ncbi:hypothetical protein PROFUN_10350 [Planoprotostelium fungivorum]|uniref:Uncharacterized protein n=1 Tax=Planoprotostelium fungivorum TaxID=1890364 RepID=A0A2P6NDZ4_9EUKA|nr:hypothetical protein PROFUN_10350 [Planoprotostelium fungivorum]
MADSACPKKLLFALLKILKEENSNLSYRLTQCQKDRVKRDGQRDRLGEEIFSQGCKGGTPTVGSVVLPNHLINLPVASEVVLA